MDRAEQTGLGIALVGHAALFAMLALAATGAKLPPIQTQPIEVTFFDEAGPTSASPTPAAAPPAPSVAPELGTPEEAIPQPAETVALPEPARIRLPAPTPLPAPAPARKAAPPPVPQAKAQPKARPPAIAQVSRGSRLGSDFLKGIGRDPTASRSQAAPAAALSAQTLAGIRSLIQSQIQPCADRQRDPGPGANQIRVTLNLRLNRDGSLARKPEVVRTVGLTDENSRYESRVKDLAVAAYVGCSPLRDLPAEYYQTPSGGWSNLNMTYRLP
jgi:hypothetical protein